MNPYQRFIYISRYARWDEEKARREMWDETVDRFIRFMGQQCKGKVDDETLEKIRANILELKVMPSMRCLMTAGPALARDNAAAFNCSALSVDSLEAFDEAMYLLMCGSGVGFSVEEKFVNKLPSVAGSVKPSKSIIKVEDSREGWCNAFRELLSLLYSGRIPGWDMSEVRPAGAPLKTFGGRASGPAPLENLFQFCAEVIQGAAGRRLTSIECHDIMCKVAEIVVAGGVRRAAAISLSNMNDLGMRNAKRGNWYEATPWRGMANNSAVYPGRPSMDAWFAEWTALYKSQSGERGVINREAMIQHAKDGGRRNVLDANGIEYDYLVNPCAEITLRPMQQCNLSEIVIRPGDTLEDLKEKAKIAAIIGTMQATLTDFRYLRAQWKKNADEEALLGVSLTGIMDHSVMSGAEGMPKLQQWLTELKKCAIDTNAEWADKIGINRAAAVTCVKPSGTVSQLVNSSSGIHPRRAKKFIRTVRGNFIDPVTKFMIEQGFPWEPEHTRPDTVAVFSFPIEVESTGTTVANMHPIDQLKLWKTYFQYWAEHQVSVTVNVGEDEWMEVGAWVYKNFKHMAGVSFLPKLNHTYKQAPEQLATEEQFEELKAKMPQDVDWTGVSKFEKDSSAVKGTQTLACTGNSCELVDL